MLLSTGVSWRYKKF